MHGKMFRARHEASKQRGFDARDGKQGTWPFFHPSMNEAELFHKEGIVSVYNGKRVPTKRKRRGGSWGDIDPPNRRMVQLIDGELDVAELDDEEVAYGITKCDDGKFSAKAAYHASRLPKRVKDQMQRELFKRADRLMRGNLLASIEAIIEIATSPGSEDRDRLKAAQYILERIQGKTPDVVTVSQEKPWEHVLAHVVAGERPARALDNAEDAEWYEDEENSG